VPDDDLERLRALFEHVHELENNMSPFQKVKEPFAKPSVSDRIAFAD
jgi:hypothetical protein